MDKLLDIVEVRSVWDDCSANQLLKTGKWILISAGVAHKGISSPVGTYHLLPVYLLGRINND